MSFLTRLISSARIIFLPIVCVVIHEHILKFEVRETHYGTMKKQYLDAELNIYKMFEMFQIDRPELRDKVKCSFYFRYFKKNFSLSFGRDTS